MFPVITKEIQKNFEAKHGDDEGIQIPIICGYKGRACRQMGKEEGANRVNCLNCSLSKFAMCSASVVK